MSTCATHPSLLRPQSLHLHLQLARNANGTSLRVTATQFAAMDTLSLPALPFMEVCLIAAMPLSPPVITRMFVPLLLRRTVPQPQVLSAALPPCPRRLRDHRPWMVEEENKADELPCLVIMFVYERLDASVLWNSPVEAFAIESSPRGLYLWKITIDG